MTKSKNNTSKNTKSTSKNQDNIFFLKIVLYMMVGMQWLRFIDSGATTQYPIPIGLIIGFLFARTDHFQIDRKIEYAILVIAMIVGFWTQIGIVISI